MTGINRYSGKEKRKMRRHNHIARDLRTPKYQHRVVSNKKKQKDDYENWKSRNFIQHLDDLD